VLASNGQNQRREWFGTACCPANIARLVTSVGNYIYGKSNDGIWINLFVGSNANIKISNTEVAVKMETNYPWDGKVKLNIDAAKKQRFKVFIRVPEWTDNANPNLDKDSYQSTNGQDAGVIFYVNRKPVAVQRENGYAIIDRDWQKKDEIEFEWTMNIHLMGARKDIEQDNDRLAIQRGPIVYCVEGADNKQGVWNLILPEKTNFTATSYKILDESVVALQAEVPSAIANEKGDGIKIEDRKITAIPYYCWANRGANDMQVWLPTKIKEVKVNYFSK
jgi:hypothetical protein